MKRNKQAASVSDEGSAGVYEERVKGFMTRHQTLLRNPVAMPAAGIMGFNKVNVKIFFIVSRELYKSTYRG